MGFKVSPVLWQKIKTGLSAGRVQSVAVKLIVEREREIKVFVPDESWSVIAPAETDSIRYNIELSKVNGKTAKLKTSSDFEKFLGILGIDSSDIKYAETKK